MGGSLRSAEQSASRSRRPALKKSYARNLTQARGSGAVALATGVSLASGLPFVIIRKAGKEYGTTRLVEGELFPGDRVLLIEDVVSSGAQAIRAAEQIGRAGAEVAGIVAVIDREQGGAENIAAQGFHYQALFTRTDLGL